MEAKKRAIENYLSPDGKDVFQRWLKRVRDCRAKQAIRIRLNRVFEGNFGDCKSVGDGVHERRIDVGAGYRVYFGEDGGTVILLGGSRKNDQDAQIKIAKARWSEYNA